MYNIVFSFFKDFKNSLVMRAISALFTVLVICLSCLSFIGVAWVARRIGFDITQFNYRPDPYVVFLASLALIAIVMRLFGISATAVKKLVDK